MIKILLKTTWWYWSRSHLDWKDELGNNKKGARAPPDLAILISSRNRFNWVDNDVVSQLHSTMRPTPLHDEVDISPQWGRLHSTMRSTPLHDEVDISPQWGRLHSTMRSTPLHDGRWQPTTVWKQFLSHSTINNSTTTILSLDPFLDRCGNERIKRWNS